MSTYRGKIHEFVSALGLIFKVDANIGGRGILNVKLVTVVTGVVLEERWVIIYFVFGILVILLFYMFAEINIIVYHSFIVFFFHVRRVYMRLKILSFVKIYDLYTKSASEINM